MDTTHLAVPEIALLPAELVNEAASAAADAAYDALEPQVRQGFDYDWASGYAAGLLAALPFVTKPTLDTPARPRPIYDVDTLARVIFDAVPPMNPHGPDSDLVFDEPYTRRETERARTIARAIIARVSLPPTAGQMREQLAEEILAQVDRSPMRDDEEQTAFALRLVRADYYAQAAQIVRGLPRG